MQVFKKIIPKAGVSACPQHDPTPIAEDAAPQKPEEVRSEKKAAPASKAVTVHNLLILDESGSMHSIYNQALSGANETIQSIRAAQENYPGQNHRFSFVTFNTVGKQVKTVIDDAPIADVKDLKESDYRPNACTPLYDAMGMSIPALERKVKEGDSVLVTVITDGLENASREYSGKAVKEMVTRLREKGWTFVYIGANQDAVEVARELNINNSLNFSATAAGTGAMFDRHRRGGITFYAKIHRGSVLSRSDEDFFNEKAAATRVTPDYVTTLAPGQVFVFGSNPAGLHDGGAAAVAYGRFGAVLGQGAGLQGDSYAIPTTLDSVEAIRPFVDEFIEFAAGHPEKTFLVTRIGCGVAGFTDEQIAPLFEKAVALPNVHLPLSFWHYINRNEFV